MDTWCSYQGNRCAKIVRCNSEGASYRRNRRDLIKTTEATNQQQRLEDSETNTTSPVQDQVSSEKVSLRVELSDHLFGLKTM